MSGLWWFMQDSSTLKSSGFFISFHSLIAKMIAKFGASYVFGQTHTNPVHPRIPEHPRPWRVKDRAILVGDAAGYVTKCSGHWDSTGDILILAILTIENENMILMNSVNGFVFGFSCVHLGRRMARDVRTWHGIHSMLFHSWDGTVNSIKYSRNECGSTTIAFVHVYLSLYVYIISIYIYIVI